MGNPNSRKRSIEGHQNSLAPGGVDPLPPKLLSILTTPSTPVIPPNKIQRRRVPVASESGSPQQLLYAPQPLNPRLAFKSYKNGNLITNNFSGKASDIIQPFPPPPHSFDPKAPEFVLTGNGSTSNMCVPDRVPGPNPLVSEAAARVGHSSRSGLDNMREMLSAIQQTPPDQMIPKNLKTPGAPKYNHVRRAHAENKATSSDEAVGLVKQSSATIPPKHLKAGQQSLIFYARKDQMRKDIIVTEKGLERNLLEGEQTYTEDGTPIQTFTDQGINFATEFQAMRNFNKWEYVSKSQVEIVVVMQSAAEEEACFAALTDEKTGFEPSTTMASVPNVPSIIQAVRDLPKHFLKNVKNLTVTLQFPAPATDAPGKFFLPKPIAELYNPALTSKDKLPVVLPSDTFYKSSQNFRTVGLLVEEIFKNKKLKCLNVVLASPASMRTPLTLHQLNCVLPFYDLDFTDWKVFWSSPHMSQPERLHGFPLEYMDRERFKICHERERRVEEEEERLQNMTFVHKSNAPTLDISPVKTKQAEAKTKKSPSIAQPKKLKKSDLIEGMNSTGGEITFVKKSTGRIIDLTPGKQDHKRRKL